MAKNLVEQWTALTAEALGHMTGDHDPSIDVTEDTDGVEIATGYDGSSIWATCLKCSWERTRLVL